MRAYYVISLTILHTFALSTAPRNNVTAQTWSIHARCWPDLELCEADTGVIKLAKSLWHYIEKDAAHILVGDDMFQPKDLLSTRKGDIFVFAPADGRIPKLQHAVVDAETTFRLPSLSSHLIRVSTGGEIIGLIVAEQLTPDSTLPFESLVSDPLIAAVPTGLRPLIDLESMVPSPTKGCLSTECVIFVPVSAVRRMFKIQ